MPLGFLIRDRDAKFTAAFDAVFAPIGTAVLPINHYNTGRSHQGEGMGLRAPDEEFTHNGELMSLRLIYLHMIEEYARHIGHADFLREQIDGATGE